LFFVIVTAASKHGSTPDGARCSSLCPWPTRAPTIGSAKNSTKRASPPCASGSCISRSG